MSKKTVVIISIITLLAVAAVVFLMTSSNFSFMSNDSKGSDDPGGGVATVVCDEFDVDRYNEVSGEMLNDGGQPGSDSHRDLTALLGEIKSKEGYQDDITCQNIIFLSELDSMNHKEAKSASESIKKLEAGGASLDAEGFHNYYPTSDHGYILDTISDEEDTTGAARGD